MIHTTTGIKKGEYTLLMIMDSNGDMVNILSLLGNSGSGIITGILQPLNISSGILSIDLSTYATNLSLSNTLNSYTDTTNLNLLLAAKQNT